jgi:carboxymethylenebutenolidase
MRGTRVGEANMPDILIQGGDGFFSAYRAPARSGRGPGILLIQEIFGVNRVMRDIADWLAGENYTVICPDLFWRQEPGIQLNEFTQAEWDKAFQLYQGFNEDKGVEDIAAAIKHLRGDQACSGKVGTVGYCLGGKLAFLSAARTDADAAVGYYGVGIEKNLGEAGSIKKPLMLHIAKLDKFVPLEAQQKIHAALGGNPRVTIYDYEGCDHAFARKGGDHYNMEAANSANGRTLGFFKRHLAAPAPRPASAQGELGLPPKPSPKSPAGTGAPGPQTPAPKPQAPVRPVVAPKPTAPKPAAPAPATSKPAAAAAPKPAAAKPKAAAKKPAAKKPKAKAKTKKPAVKRAAPKRKAAKKAKARKPAKRKASKKRGRR